MRILVVKDKVLDTKTGTIENSSTFDIDKIGCPVIFNVHDEGSEKYCDVCFGSKIAIHQVYSTTKEKLKTMKAYEVADQVEPQPKVKRKPSTKTTPAPKSSRPKIDKDAMFTQDLSEEERDKIKAGNLNVKREGRIVWASRMTSNRTVEGESARQMMLEAKQWLKKNYLFYYQILYNLDERYTEDDSVCPTLGVTPSYLYINSKFVTKCTPKELRFILAHEASHIIFKHPAKLKERDPEIWNIAGDIYINKALAEDFKITPEKSGQDVEFAHGGLWVPNIDLEVDVTEVIYNELMEEMSKQSGSSGQQGNSGAGNGNGSSGGQSSSGNNNQSNGSGSGSGNDKENKNNSGNGGGVKEITFRGKKLKIHPSVTGDVMMDDTNMDRNPRELERRMGQVVKNAIAATKQAGKGLGNMERLFELSERTPAPSWTNLLSPYLMPAQQIDYSYNRSLRNRITRMSGGRTILMGGKRPPTQLKHLCIGIDSSGSITKEERSDFLNQLKGFMEVRKHVQGHLCYWDGGIASSGEFKTFEDALKIEPKGGGGTEVEACLQFAKENQCKYVVIFTDGYFTLPKAEEWERYFRCVLWVIHSQEDYDRFEPSFGKKCMNYND